MDTRTLFHAAYRACRLAVGCRGGQGLTTTEACAVIEAAQGRWRIAEAAERACAQAMPAHHSGGLYALRARLRR